MKIMKLSLSLIVFFLMLSNAIAQNNFSDENTPEKRAKAQTEWMKTELDLDSVQVEKVHAINLKYANKLEGIKNSSGDRRQKFKKLRSLSSDKDSDMKNVLTNEQYKMYQRKKDEIRSEIKNRRKNR